MDPLSIVASIIAVIQAADRVGSLLSKLRCLSNAPLELHALVNEVSDMRIVLYDLRATLRDIGAWDTLPPERLMHLKKFVISSEAKLNEVEMLISGRFITEAPVGGKVKINRTAWVRRKGHVNSLKNELRELRVAISTSLTAINSSIQARIGLTVNEIFVATTQTSQQVEENAYRLAEILRVHTATQTLLQRAMSKHESERVLLNKSPLQLVPDRIDRTTTIGITMSKPKIIECYARCACNCHKRRIMNLTPLMRSVFGNLFIGYNGSPLWSQQCSEATCLRLSVSSATVTYSFPHWLLHRAVVFAFHNSATPALSLKFPRILPGDADIFYFIRSGNVDSVRSLFTKGLASPCDISNIDGITTLHIAIDAQSSNIEMCRLLLAEGADPHGQDSTPFSKSALDFAWDKILEASVPPSFSQALQDTFPSAGNLEDRNFSKLHKIILGLDSGELGPTLQGSRSSIDSIDKDGRSALHWVADRGEASMLNSLLRCGADPNLASFEGRTPLHRAAIAGSLECVEFLLAAGAETTPRDRWGKTPLHRGAIFHDDLKFLDPLIASGCDINATDMFGDTPLAYAARTNKARAVSYLLDHGANIDQRCDLGYTAVLNATERNSHNALLLLLERGAQPRITTIGQNSILHIVAEHGDVRTMEIFTNLKLCNLDAHAKNTNGETALDILKRRIDRPSEITEAFEGLLSSVGREDGSNDPVCQPTDDGDDGGNEDVPEFVDALEEPQC